MIKREYLVILILVVLLFLQLVPSGMTVWLGEDAVLKTRLYDPRDVFRGDYVALDFEQEQVDRSRVELSQDELDELRGEYVYALLTEGDDVFEVSKVVAKRPQEGLYLRCRLDYVNKMDRTVNLRFDVERYYVQENTGKPIEDAARSGELYAVVRLWRGYMVMTDLEIRENE